MEQFIVIVDSKPCNGNNPQDKFITPLSGHCQGAWRNKGLARLSRPLRRSGDPSTGMMPLLKEENWILMRNMG